MLKTKEKWPAMRSLRGWAISVLRTRTRSTNARHMAGQRTARILTPASAPSSMRCRTRPQAWLGRQQRRKFGEVLDSIGDSLRGARHQIAA